MSERKRLIMMPLTLAAIGENNIVKQISGLTEVKKHLEDLGFVPGSIVSVISTLGEDLIVSVKESRVAISRETAQNIMI